MSWSCVELWAGAMSWTFELKLWAGGMSYIDKLEI